MTTTTIITHNKPSPFMRQVFRQSDGKKALDIPDDAVSATVFVGPDSTSVDFFRSSEPEPKQISDMPYGVPAMVVNASNQNVKGKWGGRWVIRRSCDSAVWLQDATDALHFEGDGDSSCTVRVLQPDESLTIKVVKDGIMSTDTKQTWPCDTGPYVPPGCAKGQVTTVVEKFGENPSADDDMHIEVTSEPEPKYEITRTEPITEVTGRFDVQLVDAPDDQFERLDDGTQKECDNCIDGFEDIPGPCKAGRASELVQDSRGMHNCSHPCWRPQPQTLDAALRTGTAEEMLSLSSRNWKLLKDAVMEIVCGESAGIMRHVINGIRSRSTDTDRDVIELAKTVIELRDRLDLFGEGK